MVRGRQVAVYVGNRMHTCVVLTEYVEYVVGRLESRQVCRLLIRTCIPLFCGWTGMYVASEIDMGNYSTDIPPIFHYPQYLIMLRKFDSRKTKW